MNELRAQIEEALKTVSVVPVKTAALLDMTPQEVAEQEVVDAVMALIEKRERELVEEIKKEMHLGDLNVLSAETRKLLDDDFDQRLDRILTERWGGGDD